MNSKKVFGIGIVVLFFNGLCVFAQKYKTDIPASLVIPDKVESRIGTLSFKDGFPDDKTAEKVYDNLDFSRALIAFLNTMPAASQVAQRKGIREFGPDNGTVLIFENLMDARSLFLTANTESMYALGWLNLKDGPVVVESPPNTLGLVDDFWYHYVTDLGLAGPDKGKGGKFIFVPPGYKGKIPTGYFVFKPNTYNLLFATRGFVIGGDTKSTAENIRKNLRIYPLSKAANPPKTNFVNVSGKSFSSIHSMDYNFFKEINEVVQEEPNDAMDAETLGLLASIGIEKGKTFNPDQRMQKILTEAASVGNATARANAYRSRINESFFFPDSAWGTCFVGGSYLFEDDGVRLWDARSYMFFYATGITPAMAIQKVGAGSAYATAFVDAQKKPFDGGKTYHLHLPPNIPAKQFWSVVLYDNQTRSMLQTDQQFPSVSSQKKETQLNADGSVDLYFGPKAPEGKESNWVQTVPDKGWSIILRLYGPQQSWFDKTWKPSEIMQVK